MGISPCLSLILYLCVSLSLSLSLSLHSGIDSVNLNILVSIKRCALSTWEKSLVPTNRAFIDHLPADILRRHRYLPVTDAQRLSHSNYRALFYNGDTGYSYDAVHLSRISHRYSNKAPIYIYTYTYILFFT